VTTTTGSCTVQNGTLARPGWLRAENKIAAPQWPSSFIRHLKSVAWLTGFFKIFNQTPKK